MLSLSKYIDMKVNRVMKVNRSIDTVCLRLTNSIITLLPASAKLFLKDNLYYGSMNISFNISISITADLSDHIFSVIVT